MHQFVATDGHLTGFWQVTIDGYQRIAALQSLGGTQSRQTGRTAVARLLVITAQPLPCVQLLPDNTEQVVSEEFAVVFLDDKRHIAVGRYLRQLFRMGQRLVTIVATLLLGVVTQYMDILAIHLRQHSSIDSL